MYVRTFLCETSCTWRILSYGVSFNEKKRSATLFLGVCCIASCKKIAGGTVDHFVESCPCGLCFFFQSVSSNKFRFLKVKFKLEVAQMPLFKDNDVDDQS